MTSTNKFLGGITILVDDYDKAIAYYTEKLGFILEQDEPQGDKRWVVVKPGMDAQTQIILAKASTPNQVAKIGSQAGERVWLFLYTRDFAQDYDSMRNAGVTFLEQPRKEAYGTVAVFQDLYGNKWDLLEPLAVDG